MHGMFSEFALILAISAMAAALGVRLRQPVIIAYIFVGIVFGPTVLDLVSASSPIELLAQLGISVLLFLVGLKLDLNQVRKLGAVSLATGLGQLTFTILFGFAIILLLGKGTMEALYVAIALTFSSTIIIVKLLSDKRELDSLHGRIAIGFLIVQDMAVVLAMMVMSVVRVNENGAEIWELLGSLSIRIMLAVVSMYVLIRWVLPRLVATMAASQELLLIFAIAWGTGLAALGEWAGFSKEAGAFLAGFAIASTGYRDAVSARLSGIRDFLLLFFFIDLGSKLDFSTLGDEMWPAVILSLFVLIGNPLVVMAIMGFMGYRKRTGFMAGLTVAQISEFSIIFIAMGISLGHVGQEALGLTTMVGIVTIALSTYMILYSQVLYEKLEPLLGVFERKSPFRETDVDPHDSDGDEPDVVVVGLGRYGSRLAMGLHDAGLRVLGVDFDPERIHEQRERGLWVHFGDGSDENFIDTLPLGANVLIVSALPDLEGHRMLIHGLKQHKFAGRILVVQREDDLSEELTALGAHQVVNPMRDAIGYTVESLVKLRSGPSQAVSGA